MLPNAVNATLATTSNTGWSGAACCACMIEPATGGRIADVGGEQDVEVTPPPGATSRRLSSSSERAATVKSYARELTRGLALVSYVRLHQAPVHTLVVAEPGLREGDEGRDHLFGDRRHLHLLHRVAEAL